MKHIMIVPSMMLLISTADAQVASNVSLSKVGTLTCTTMETSPQAPADAELSCSFRSASGGSGNLTGYIARSGEADLPPGKRVLAWSVLSSTQNIGARSLRGTYVGETGGDPPGRLVGGEGSAIVLQPTTITSQVGEEPAPTLLRLRLEPIQA